MIVEWLLDLVVSVVDWFFALFDGWEVPSIFASPPAELYSFFGFVASMGVWVPWVVISIVVLAVIGVYTTMFIVKLVKQVLSHVPQFGGAG